MIKHSCKIAWDDGKRLKKSVESYRILVIMQSDRICCTSDKGGWKYGIF